MRFSALSLGGKANPKIAGEILIVRFGADKSDVTLVWKELQRKDSAKIPVEKDREK